MIEALLNTLIIILDSASFICGMTPLIGERRLGLVKDALTKVKDWDAVVFLYKSKLGGIFLVIFYLLLIAFLFWKCLKSTWYCYMIFTVFIIIPFVVTIVVLIFVKGPKKHAWINYVVFYLFVMPAIAWLIDRGIDKFISWLIRLNKDGEVLLLVLGAILFSISKIVSLFLVWHIF